MGNNIIQERSSSGLIYFLNRTAVTAHRQIGVHWNDIAVTGQVKMLEFQEPSRIVEKTRSSSKSGSFSNNNTTTYRSQETNDKAGSRACTVVLKGSTKIYTGSKGRMAKVASQTPQISAVEYTTPESMPAQLPPNSAFTYCVDLSVNGEEHAEFDEPVAIWVENFLDFKVGEPVPVGHYNRDKAVWEPSDNGVVVRLLDTDSDGVVDGVDADDDGQPDDLNGNGLFTDEVAGLGDPNHYPPGETFWRVMVSHFSPLDLNWPYGPPSGAIGASFESFPDSSDQEPEYTVKEDCNSTGSIIKDRKGTLHQDMPIPGTDLFLHYASQAATGYTYQFSVKAIGEDVPDNLKGVDVKVEIAGRTVELNERLAPLPDQVVEINWDGLDFSGERVVGPTTAKISIGFVYDAVYYESDEEREQAFAQFGEGVGTTLNMGDGEITAWSHSQKVIYSHIRPDAIAEGWTISNHHFMVRPDQPVIIRGDGYQEMAYPHTLQDFAGTGEAGYSGDGGPAITSQLSAPSDTDTDAEGNIYIADTGNHSIRKIDRNNIISTVAGTGANGYSGDNGPAVSAELNNPVKIDVDNTGNIYISDQGNHCIRRIDAEGYITTVAGTGVAGFSGDNGPASNAQLNNPTGVTADTYGNIYIADSGNGRVRKIDPSGTITTIMGTGSWCMDGNGLFQPLPGFQYFYKGRFNYGYPPFVYENGDLGFSKQAPLNYPVAITIDDDGIIYIADKGYRKIRKIDVNGVVTSIGNVFYATGMDVDSLGNLFVSNRRGFITKVYPKSDVQNTIAGQGTKENGAAINSRVYSPSDVDDAGEMRKLFIAEPYKHRIRQVSSSMELLGAQGGEIIINGKDELRYIFNQNGLHLRTVDIHTGVILFTFTYDEEDRLIGVTDRFNNQTTVQRNASGIPESITSPDGIMINLSVDEHNQLYQVRYPGNPAPEIYSFEYDNNDGLMTAKIEPENNRFEYDFDPIGRLFHYSDEEGGEWTFTRGMNDSGEVVTTKESASGNITRYVDFTDITGAFTSSIQGATGDITLFSRTNDKLSTEKTLPCGTELTSSYNLDSEYSFPFITERTIKTPAGKEIVFQWEREYQDLDQDAVADILTETSIFNGKATTLATNFQTGSIVYTSPENRSVTTSYDPNTLLVSAESIPGLYDTTYEYYPSGHQHYGELRYIRRNTRETEFTYDASGNLYTIEDPAGNVTIFEEYDALGRLKKVKRPDNRYLWFEYDKNGNTRVLTNPSEADHIFAANKVNLRQSYQTPLSGNYVYAYDSDRRPSQILFPSGQSISWDYTTRKGTSFTHIIPEEELNL